MKYIIGVDIGTSGTKAIAMNVAGSVLHTAYESYQGISWHPDQNELEPKLLLSATVKVLKEIKEKSAGRDGLIGVCFSCALHSVIAVNKKGQPLTNAITWADLRSKSFAATLRDTVAGKEIYKNSGTPIHPMSPLCKIMWIREKMPAIFEETSKFISIKEYIWFEFFGKYQVDYSIASGTGLFDINKLLWFGPSLDAAGIGTDRLSDPVSPLHSESDLSKTYQKLTGISARTPFIIGGSDGCLANLGSHAVRPGDLALTIGTSGAVRMVSGVSQFDEKERIFNYILTEGLYVSGGAINNGGIAVKWYVDNFMPKNETPPKDFPSMVEETEKICPGSEGLIFLPYLLGERAPIWNADAKGVFFGIYSGHTAQHFLRSVIEGISFSLYQIARTLEEIITPVKKIYASGGFIHSSTWLQMIADIFNKEVCVTKGADASAVGAAIMGLYALKEIPDLMDTGKMIRT
ncbi:MAG: gluconokinase, partial [Chitinophagales bacterium]